MLVKQYEVTVMYVESSYYIFDRRQKISIAPWIWVILVVRETFKILVSLTYLIEIQCKVYTKTYDFFFHFFHFDYSSSRKYVALANNYSCVLHRYSLGLNRIHSLGNENSRILIDEFPTNKLARVAKVVCY